METQVREAFTVAGRARLAVSGAARRVCDYARSLVSLDDDAFTTPGELLACARELRVLDLIVMDRAVVYERARGTSWETISLVLGLDVEMLRERYAEDLDSLDAEEAQALAGELRQWLAIRGPGAAPWAPPRQG